MKNIKENTMTLEEIREKLAGLGRHYDDLKHDSLGKTPNGLYHVCSKCGSRRDFKQGITTHCPGRHITVEEDYAVYLGELDYLNGQWVALDRQWKLVAAISEGKRELRMVDINFIPDASMGTHPAEELIKTPSPVFTSHKEVRDWVNKYYPMYQP